MSKDEKYDVSQHEGHTPGPWWLCCEDDTLYARWIQADEKSICSDLNEATEVDAQLLAATPEILDALKKAYEENDNLEWLLAKAHGEGNMVHSLVHLGVTQQVEKLQTENTRLRDSLFIINEDMKDCEEGGMHHVRKIKNFVNDVCEAERITPHE
jgi:hypothetical protein